MTPEENVRLGKIEEALSGLQEKIRQAPADRDLRRFLWQLLCLLGKWEKALTQLQILADMDADSLLLAQAFQSVIGCEMIRSEVFQGKRSPLIFGEPKEWISWMIQANTMTGEGQYKPAQELRARALEAAPAIGGLINGEAFAWIGDADSRLGPIVEAVIDGKYFWVPFERVARISVERPSDLRDLVWIPAVFGWTNGGEATGFIPVRYPGSEASADGGIRMARKTDWVEREEETFLGLGQRMFATDQGEFPLLEIRTIELALNATETAVE
jgi:type VI secretion system protein ImpE